MTHRVGILGGSGYVGGELLRLLLFHPEVEVAQVSSRRFAGQFVHTVHPNLRGVSALRFVDPEALQQVDFLFLALPHGVAARNIHHYAERADKLLDCSADFRLRDGAAYERWYGQPHPAPNWLPRFQYGLPERRREQIRNARYVSGVGCNATALILGLAPLLEAGLAHRVLAEVKVGSSEAGAEPNTGTHHPVRSGAVRVYSPSGHRHLAEVEQELGATAVDVTVTAIEMVRGVHVSAHCLLDPGSAQISERELWQLYREAYEDEPFIRLVAARSGLYRLPEPKLVAGTNYCDVGFHLDTARGRVVVFAALDNLMKGAAGTALQSMNLMLGLDERAGLTFPGLHPT